MSIVPNAAQPNMGQVALGAVVEVIGILVVILPGLLEDGEIRFVMPWVLIGGVLVAIGGAISLKAILDARRAGI